MAGLAAFGYVAGYYFGEDQAAACLCPSTPHTCTAPCHVRIPRRTPLPTSAATRASDSFAQAPGCTGPSPRPSSRRSSWARPASCGECRTAQVSEGMGTGRGGGAGLAALAWPDDHAVKPFEHKPRATLPCACRPPDGLPGELQGGGEQPAARDAARVLLSGPHSVSRSSAASGAFGRFRRLRVMPEWGGHVRVE